MNSQPKNTRPLVNVATACEKVLIEKDDVATAVRIVDVYYLPESQQPMPAGTESVIPISSLICIKAGDFEGEGVLSVALQTPDGQRKEIPQKWPIILKSGPHGSNLVLNFALSTKYVGQSWVEVLWDGELLTKFPIMLVQGPKPADKSQTS